MLRAIAQMPGDLVRLICLMSLLICCGSYQASFSQQMVVQDRTAPRRAPGKPGLAPVTLTTNERIAGFVRLWSEVKYNFAFFHRIPEVRWENVLDEYLPKVQQAQSAEEYYLLLQQCVARLKDGHTTVYLPRPLRKRATLPFRLRTIEGKVVVTGVAPAAVFLQPVLEPGLEIMHIDGRPVSDILDKDVYPYVADSTPQNRDRHALRRLIAGDKSAEATVRLREASGGMRTLTLARLHWEFPRAAQFACHDLGAGVVYLALDSFSGKRIVAQFRAVFGKIQQAKGLIIDVRDNSGGSSSTGYSIISHLIDKPVRASRWRTRKYMPAFRAWGRKEAWFEGEPRLIKPGTKAPYLGPVIVLIGPGTVSAAEDFVVALHAAGRATLIGQKTAGTTGQPLLVRLPGGGKARICTKHDSYPDGREFVGIGIVPDVTVHPTRQSIAARRDVVLEKALDVLGLKLHLGASRFSTEAVLKRRRKREGQDEPPDLMRVLVRAKATYDALLAACAKKDWRHADAKGNELSDILRPLLLAISVDRERRGLQARGNIDQQRRYYLHRLEDVRRQIRSLCRDDSDFAEICRSIVEIEDLSDEIHDSARDRKFDAIPGDLDKLKKAWEPFWKRASSGRRGLSEWSDVRQGYGWRGSCPRHLRTRRTVLAVSSP